MKRLKKFALGIIIITLLVCIPCLTAYAASGDTVVYKTKTGKCYHSAGCSSLSKSSIEISLQEATSSGLTPCSKCKPPKLDTASTATQKKVETKNATTNVQSDGMVWLSATGSKYHSKNDCGNMNPAKAIQITESEAILEGMTKCSKCWK